MGVAAYSTHRGARARARRSSLEPALLWRSLAVLLACLFAACQPASAQFYHVGGKPCRADIEHNPMAGRTLLRSELLSTEPPQPAAGEPFTVRCGQCGDSGVPSRGAPWCRFPNAPF